MDPAQWPGQRVPPQSDVRHGPVRARRGAAALAVAQRSTQRLPEPLASQLRTIVALHDDARLVLAPVELRLEAATGQRGPDEACCDSCSSTRARRPSGGSARSRAIPRRRSGRRSPASIASQAQRRASRRDTLSMSPGHAHSGRRHRAVDQQRDRQDSRGGRRRHRVGHAGRRHGRRRALRRSDSRRDARFDQAHEARAQRPARDAGRRRLSLDQRRAAKNVRSLRERASRAYRSCPAAGTRTSTSC